MRQSSSVKFSGNILESEILDVHLSSISGDDSCGVPPVPIPNTVVKLVHAEGTWLETAREDK